MGDLDYPLILGYVKGGTFTPKRKLEAAKIGMIRILLMGFARVVHPLKRVVSPLNAPHYLVRVLTKVGLKTCAQIRSSHILIRC